MSSRVLHLRLPEEDIVGCFDLFEAVGKSHYNTPLATVVTSALIAALNGYRRDGIIPTYEPEQLAIRITELLPDDEIPRLAVRGAPIFPTEEQVLNMPNFEDMAARPSEEVEDEGSLPEPVKLNLDDVELLSKDEILAQAPKDRLAEMCESEEAWAALGIVYKAIPLDLWGSRQAERLFLKTLTELRSASNER